MNKNDSEQKIGAEAPTQNIKLLDEVASRLSNEFNHTHGSPTDSDAMLLVAMMNPQTDGMPKDGQAMAGVEYFRGCEHDLIGMLENFLARNPDFIPIFAAGLAGAAQQLGRMKVQPETKN